MSQQETVLDLNSYLTQPLAWQPGEKLVATAAGYLLDNKIASALATKFLIGAENVVFYGQPLVMKTRCKFLDGIEFTGGTVRVAPQADLSHQNNLKALVAAWLFINGITRDHIWPYGQDLETRLLTWRWLIYFRPIEIGDDDLEGPPFTTWIEDIVTEVKRKSQAGEQFTQSEQQLLQGLFRSLVKMSVQSEGADSRWSQNLLPLALLVGVSGDEREAMLSRFRRRLAECEGRSNETCPEDIQAYSKVLGITLPEGMLARMRMPSGGDSLREQMPVASEAEVSFRQQYRVPPASSEVKTPPRSVMRSSGEFREAPSLTESKTQTISTGSRQLITGSEERPASPVPGAPVGASLMQQGVPYPQLSPAIMTMKPSSIQQYVQQYTQQPRMPFGWPGQETEVMAQQPQMQLMTERTGVSPQQQFTQYAQQQPQQFMQQSPPQFGQQFSIPQQTGGVSPRGIIRPRSPSNVSPRQQVPMPQATFAQVAPAAPTGPYFVQGSPSMSPQQQPYIPPLQRTSPLSLTARSYS